MREQKHVPLLAPEGGGAGPTYEMRVGVDPGFRPGGDLGVCSPFVVLCAGIMTSTLLLCLAALKSPWVFGLSVSCC